MLISRVSVAVADNNCPPANVLLAEPDGLWWCMMELGFCSWEWENGNGRGHHPYSPAEDAAWIDIKDS